MRIGFHTLSKSIDIAEVTWWQYGTIRCGNWIHPQILNKY